MNNVKTMSNTQIFFFPLEEKNSSYCQLKLLSNFIRFKFKQTVFKFSYVDTDGSMLGDLSLHENIKLSSDNADIDSFSSFEIETILNEFGNIYLSRLFRQLEDMNVAHNNADNQTRKITALIKSFFRSGPFYLYHNPEKFLSEENLELFIKALEFQALTNNHMVLIASQNQKLWNKFSTHLVKRDHNRKFQVLPIIRQSESGVIVKKEKIEVESGLIIKNMNYKKAG